MVTVTSFTPSLTSITLFAIKIGLTHNGQIETAGLSGETLVVANIKGAATWNRGSAVDAQRKTLVGKSINSSTRSLSSPYRLLFGCFRWEDAYRCGLKLS
jgi:hypothetical protein